MITLYHCRDARSFRALWALEECGVPYDLKLLPFPPRYREKSFLEENPLGTIPLLIDGSERLTESAAICEYVASRYGKDGIHVKPDEPGYGAYLNALHYGEATLTFPQTLVLRYRMFEPDERKQPQVAEDYAKWFIARLQEGLMRTLDTHEFVAADRFTAADISVAYALLLAETLKLISPFPGNIQNYWERMQARPAFQRAKEAQKGIASPLA